MIQRAWEVLLDCKRAYELLEEETRADTFRVLWVAGVALSRAVGHVLQKVDGASDDATGEAVERAYASWKSNRQANAIFWGFIEEERNQVLKQYELGFLTGPVDLVAGDQRFTLDEQVFCPLASGPFAGEDCRDVLQLAIEWWERQLKDIEGVRFEPVNI
jgi:hypothetical protein